LKLRQWRTIFLMQIEFDPAKEAANIRKHDVSLAFAVVVLSNLRHDDIDRRFDYGEDRRVAYGSVDGRLFVCVYTMRGADTHRIISLRKANWREVERYG
jgi:uncharacterized DUF497 family protein